MAKILYIEDIPDNAKLAERIIVGRGHTFYWAPTGEEGLNMALEIVPDLILLDLGLPDVDGQTLSVYLHNELSLSGIPLVALTAWPPEAAQRMVAEYHFDAYLAKPLTIHSLMSTIDSLLKRA